MGHLKFHIHPFFVVQNLSDRLYKKVRFGKDFDGIQIAQRYYRLEYIGTQDKGIVMSGADVTVKFNIPFTFMINRVEITHLSTTDALSVDEVEATFKRANGDILDVPLARSPYWQKKQLNASRMIIDFTDKKLVFESGTHTYIFNTTSTDKLIVLIYIERLN